MSFFGATPYQLHQAAPESGIVVLNCKSRHRHNLWIEVNTRCTTGNSFCTTRNNFHIVENNFCTTGKNLWIVGNTRCITRNIFCPTGDSFCTMENNFSIAGNLSIMGTSIAQQGTIIVLPETSFGIWTTFFCITGNN